MAWMPQPDVDSHDRFYTPAVCAPYSFNLLNKVFWLMPSTSAARSLVVARMFQRQLDQRALRLLDGGAYRNSEFLAIHGGGAWQRRG